MVKADQESEPEEDPNVIPVKYRQKNHLLQKKAPSLIAILNRLIFGEEYVKPKNFYGFKSPMTIQKKRKFPHLLEQRINNLELIAREIGQLKKQEAIRIYRKYFHKKIDENLINEVTLVAKCLFSEETSRQLIKPFLKQKKVSTSYLHNRLATGDRHVVRPSATQKGIFGGQASECRCVGLFY